MKNIKLYLYILAAPLLLAACRPTVLTPKATSGGANFSTYISLGNSLTSGYADGGLYLAGQLNSYPSIIAKQMLSVGGGTFTQPLFPTTQANGSGYETLTGFAADGVTPIIAPVTTNLAIRGVLAVPGFGNVTLYTKYTGAPINNFGVPGIKLEQITYAPLGNLNGYFERLLPGNAPNNSTTYLSFVTANPFTFFTNWLGNNDALLYATSGGAGDVLTDVPTFTALNTLLINTLTANGAKGAVATVPDVTSIPYFNTVTIAALLAGVQKANPTVTGIYINAQVPPPPGSPSPTTPTYAPRLATASDLIVLTFPTSMIGQIVTTPYGPLPYGLTPYSPIDNQYVLDAYEVALAQAAVIAYNSTIVATANAKGLAIFDAYTFLRNVKANGLVTDGITLSSNYITGGLFSLDGVHLTPRGYSIVANEFIKAINSKYGSNIPLADVASYSGIKFP